MNECELSLDNCSQICLDTTASYLCACSVGYALDADEISCNGMSYMC